MNIQEITNFEEMLWVGAAHNSVDLVRIALENGADIEARNIWQETPLHRAALNNFLEVVKLLIENGSDVDAKDITQRTPLHEAAIRGYTEMKELLKSYGASYE